jgi:hypothetical protein
VEGDARANLMYYAWIKHGWAPSKIYNMSQREQELLMALYIIEVESRHSFH